MRIIKILFLNILLRNLILFTFLFIRMVDYVLKTKKFCEEFFDQNPCFFKNKDGSQKTKPSGIKLLSRMVLNNVYNVLKSIYKQAYPTCNHNQKHIVHGLFDKFVHNKSWLKRFYEAKSVIVFAKPDSKNTKARLVLIDRKILKFSQLKCKIYQRDKNALKKANIKFGDIMWSIREIKNGKYFFNEKENEYYRKYK